MSVRAADVYERLKKIRYECTAIQSALTDVFAMLNELGLQDAPAAVCEKCQLECAGALTLAEHVYTSHDGPLPEHWERTDERVAKAERAAAAARRAEAA